MIEPAVRARLERIVGSRSELARVHTDRGADEIARAERADAVTAGRDIYFKRGAYRPDDRRGFALLTHEVVHVLRAIDPGASWRRATASGVAEEERAARRTEQAIVGVGPDPMRNYVDASGISPGSFMPAGASPPVPLAIHRAPLPAAGSPAEMRPMSAATDREAEPPPARTWPPVEHEELRRSIYRDLLRQIKTDFERGG
jgi:hypothetical protein